MTLYPIGAYSLFAWDSNQGSAQVAQLSDTEDNESRSRPEVKERERRPKLLLQDLIYFTRDLVELD